MKYNSIIQKCEAFYKLATEDLVHARPLKGVELLYLAGKMKEEGIPFPDLFIEAGKLIESGQGIPTAVAFKLLKLLNEQLHKGFYEGHRELSYNKSVGQGHPHSLEREDWHRLGKLLSSISVDFFPE